MKERKVLRSIIRFAPNALINIFAIFIVALMTVVTFGLDFSYIWSWEFLATTAALVVIFMLVHWSFTDGRVKAKRDNKENKEYLKEQEQDIKKSTDTIEWIETRQEFVNERNQKEKISEHIAITQKKIEKLKRKAKRKDLIIEGANVTDLQRQNLSADIITELEKSYDNARLTNKYVQKKRELEIELTEKWIADNINKIYLSYNEIDINFIEKGVQVQRKKRDKVSPKGKYLKDNGLSRLAALFLTIGVSSIAAQPLTEGGTPEQWALFGLRFMIIIYNVITGLNYGDRFYEEVDVHNTETRLSLTKEWKKWALDKGYLVISKGVVNNG